MYVVATTVRLGRTETKEMSKSTFAFGCHDKTDIYNVQKIVLFGKQLLWVVDPVYRSIKLANPFLETSCVEKGENEDVKVFISLRIS